MNRHSTTSPTATRITRGAVALTALTLAALATGCGGGLSYTVPDKEVRTLTGPDAEKVAAAKADVAKAKAAYSDSKLAIRTSNKDVEAAEKATEKAESQISAAEKKVDRADSGLEKAVETAESKRDKAYAVAKAAYEKAIAAAKGTYGQEVAAAKQKFGAEKKEGMGELKSAEKLRKIEEAREAYQKALLDEREAREEEADAALWAAKANYELAKFDALMAAKSKSGADVNEERLDFKEQASERQSILLDRQREVVAYQKETERARKALEKLEGKKTPPPADTAPKAEPPAPAVEPTPEAPAASPDSDAPAAKPDAGEEGG